MPKTIWKFGPLQYGHQLIRMPATADILSAQLQGGAVFLWALVDLDNTALAERTVLLIGTGQTCNLNGCRFLSTVQQSEYVWHVFVSA